MGRADGRFAELWYVYNGFDAKHLISPVHAAPINASDVRAFRSNTVEGLHRDFARRASTRLSASNLPAALLYAGVLCSAAGRAAVPSCTRKCTFAKLRFQTHRVERRFLGQRLAPGEDTAGFAATGAATESGARILVCHRQAGVAGINSPAFGMEY